jgi:N-methylhydantoinase A/oxoprolinase/acetone carboxylase beta subunit
VSLSPEGGDPHPPHPPSGLRAHRPPSDAAVPSGRRRVCFEAGWFDTPVYERGGLRAGVYFDGPAIVEQLDSTTVVELGDRVEVDRDGNLIMTVRGVA